ncbi:preprotein translocase subunit SecE [Lactococcus lactis subsp. lactis]|uniref:preprotein translocase subunit SecE n=1 Tax=Lactococcus lactis TaxID=1358 RepID=UPI0021AE8969|nr:preprotein translocase subunit SecE [Lactococcus lactis]MCT0016790.1 preprotein translocase subunit SecE [Lactococcus lactis subsp. lactis]
MINYLKNVRKESDKIKWLSLTQIIKETVTVILVSILFALFIGGGNWLLQQTFNHLLTNMTPIIKAVE